MRLPKPSPKKQSFLKNEEGGILILVGLAIVFLVGIGGAAVDLGTQQLMRVKLQNSVDAAATSAASLITCRPAPINDTDRRAAAQRYFDLNYPVNFAENTRRPTPTIEIVPKTATTQGTITVTAADDITTRFVNNFAVPQLNASVSSRASVYDRYWDRSFDVVMLVDETGSMARPVGGGGGTREQAARNALNVFVRKMFPDCVENPNARMGLVGFAGFTTNLWGLTGARATALTYTTKTRAVGYNTEEIGLRAASNMLFEEAGSPTGDPSWSLSSARKPWYGHEKPLYFNNPAADPTQPSGTPPPYGVVPRMEAPDYYEYGYKSNYKLLPYDGYSNTSRGAASSDELADRNNPSRCLADHNQRGHTGHPTQEGYQDPYYAEDMTPVYGDHDSNPATPDVIVGSVGTGHYHITGYPCQPTAGLVPWGWPGTMLPLKPAPYNDLSVDFDTRVPAPLIARDATVPVEQRLVILISDGSIATDSTTADGSSSYSVKVAPMLAECERIRSKGGLIYAINFTSTDPDDENALKTCSDNHYYFAPDEATLRSILLEIAAKTKITRILQ